MSQRNHGGVFITLLGLFGVLIFIAGLSMLLGSQGKIVTVCIAVVPMIIGGAIVFEVLKSQKKK
jgi:hypothetical protein